MPTTTDFATPRRLLPNGGWLSLVPARAAPRPARWRARLEDFAIAVQMVALGLLFAPTLVAILALAYWLKSSLGIDLMDGPSPVHEFLDNLRQAGFF